MKKSNNISIYKFVSSSWYISIQDLEKKSHRSQCPPDVFKLDQKVQSQNLFSYSILKMLSQEKHLNRSPFELPAN